VNGAFWFGAVVGWFLYFTNRYRKDVSLSDVAALLGAVGGAAITALFDRVDGTGANLFLSYGAGLAFGFFAYFAILVALVLLSKDEFTLAYLIDGRRKDPAPGSGYAEASQRPVRSNYLRTLTRPGAPMRMLQPVPAAVPGDHAAIDSQHEVLASAIDEAAQALMARYNDADPAARSRLTDAVRQLDAQRDRIDAAAIRADLTVPELQRAVAQLATVADGIKAEAKNVRDAASALAAAAKVVNLVSQAIGILAMLA